MADVGVRPYWELTFDADGDPNPAQRDRLIAQAHERGVTDLLVFAHGWNNDRSIATELYRRFFAPFPGLAPGVKLGYVGVLWPAMRFSDEPIPDFDPAVLGAMAAVAEGASEAEAEAEAEAESELPEPAEMFPGSTDTLGRLQQLLDEQPESEEALGEFGGLVRRLYDEQTTGHPEGFEADTEEGAQGDRPAMLTEDVTAVCEAFAEASYGPLPESVRPLGMLRIWSGAKELLRQTAYYVMKRRAGTVGQLGLGAVLGLLAQRAPQVRVHLIGHSFGGRLVSYALRGLPDKAHNVKSVTLLQGAFSHYAFAPRLPHQQSKSGALRGWQERVDGPVVCCFSKHDLALQVMYPLASRMARDSSSLLGFDRRWGAMGFDGVQALDGTVRLTLREALRGPIPAVGCVNVDAAEVVHRGGPPIGAHSDICHKELARLVISAGRIE
ncbi:serine-threonine protein kinase [Streptomyces sp. NBC_01304]|nr:serine-threonine protein kinase [Streptomyces sp. NBC_01304]